MQCLPPDYHQPPTRHMGSGVHTPAKASKKQQSLPTQKLNPAGMHGVEQVHPPVPPSVPPVVTQLPLLHTWFVAHARPQPPQLLTSPVVSTQLLLQQVLVQPVQPPLVAHAPLTQVFPEPQGTPQAPQLLLSVFVFTQPLVRVLAAHTPWLVPC